MGVWFATTKAESSSNYGVDNNGNVGLFVEEKNRAWTSSSRDNDNKAVTIEVSNDGLHPTWHISNIALEKTIDLCVDICLRNDIDQLIYTGTISGNLTRHNMFANTECPGPYLQSKFPYIVEHVNKRLAPKQKIYRVQVGAYFNKSNAIAMADKLNLKGFDSYIVESDIKEVPNLEYMERYNTVTKSVYKHYLERNFG